MSAPLDAILAELAALRAEVAELRSLLPKPDHRLERLCAAISAVLGDEEFTTISLLDESASSFPGASELRAAILAIADNPRSLGKFLAKHADGRWLTRVGGHPAIFRLSRL